MYKHANSIEIISTRQRQHLPGMEAGQRLAGVEVEKIYLG
jgi:hypothetical protein